MKIIPAPDAVLRWQCGETGGRCKRDHFVEAGVFLIVWRIPNDSSLLQKKINLDTTTTSDKLYRAFASTAKHAEPQTKEVLRYRKALYEAWQQLQHDDFSVELLENIYRKIKNTQDGIRDTEVFIENRFKVVYTPPCCRDVLLRKLNNLLEYIQDDNQPDPLVKMAILHYQFEAIHPFTDGNGRAGRVKETAIETLRKINAIHDLLRDTEERLEQTPLMCIVVSL